MTRRERWIVVTVAVVAFVAAFGYTYFSLSGTDRPESRVDVHEGAGDDTIPVGASTEADTVLVVRRYWSDGTLGQEQEAALPQDLVGLTLSELQAARPEWVIAAFGPEQVMVRQSCPEVTGGFLGLERGRVAVFDGRPLGCRRVRELLDIDVASLPAFQVAELQVGIVFESGEELFQIREGLLAP